MDEFFVVTGGNMVQRVLGVIALFLFTSQPAYSYILDAHAVQNGRSHAKIENWKSAYINSGNHLLNGMPSSYDTTQEFIARISSLPKWRVYNLLNSLFQLKIGANTTASTQDYYRFFVRLERKSGSNHLMGLSQFVLATGLACHYFSHGSTFKNQLCQAYPKLAAAAVQLAVTKTPGRHKSFLTHGYFSSEVLEDRGIVLVRSLLPIFTIVSLQFNGINGTNWSTALRNDLITQFQGASKDINESLRDFITIKMVEYQVPEAHRVAGDPQFVRVYNTINRNYSTATAINYCVSVQNGFRKKCASNHSMTAYLGRLMLTVISGQGSLKLRANEFRSLIDNGILNTRAGHYVPTDHYRKDHKKGVSYALLQMQVLTAAAEILKNHSGIDLYRYNNHRFARALDFMASMTTLSAANTTFNTYFHPDEFNKYVNFADNGKRYNWTRNYGFFTIPIHRYCNQGMGINLSFSCVQQNTYSSFHNVYPKPESRVPYLELQDSIYFGPTQIMYQ